MRLRAAATAGAVGVSMANSRFQYVKKFELPDAILPDTYLITRLDGHRFTKFTADHGFTKPNDERGLLLMAEVMSEWSDLVMAFGQSDEFSFLLPASSPLYGRRSAKLSTSFVSLFSSSFVFFWPKHFPDTPLLYPPNFDARVIPYPSSQHIRDYFGWRQADCHINNLYNTCFWALVADGVPKQDAQVALKGTSSGDKNELLFSRFAINYNEIPQRFRKGTTLYRARSLPPAPVPEPLVSPSRGGTVTGNPKSGGRPEDGTALDAGGGDISKEGAAGNGATSPAIAAAESSGDSGSAIARPESQAKQEAAGEGTGVGSIAVKERARKSVEEGKKKSFGEGVVRVVSTGSGKGKSKRLLKKGHAPPGAIEEEACDIIRDDFWDRNPQILAAGLARR